ncbi:MAG: MoaD/ThiS family protein [Mariprofundaceae bacterium]|nr:MoaD/ThiS family protein [Mariprofundaceae bacterium]
MIKVLFFGYIADQMGRRSLCLEGNQSLADVMKAVGCDASMPLLLAVNQEQVRDVDMIIQNGDEVAIMPPFSGG